jgi:hypothetical protein
LIAGLSLSFDFLDVNWLRWAPMAGGIVAACLALFLGRAYLRWKAARDRQPDLFQPAPRDPFFYGSPSEKRSSARRTGKLIKVLVSDAKAIKPSVQGWVIDRSMGGLCLAVPEPVAVSTILSVRTADSPREVPWTQVEVRRCEARGDHHEIGVQFVRTPSWSVLLLFG